MKIAEGCNRQCSFCVIPSLRGVQRSRPPEDIIREVTQLTEAGVLEINLISQDTVAFGRDGNAGAALSDLVARVAEVPGVHWVRLFYLYPETLDPKLLDLLASHPKVVPYVDMPLQHAADAMLRRMKRGHGGERLRRVVTRLRSCVPGLAFRTAFIVGHPGETDDEFQELLNFVNWAEFDRVGIFRYSDEESSASYELTNKVPADVAEARAEELAELQRTISQRKHAQLIGQELEVLVVGPSDESPVVWTGRHAGQAPEIDGLVFLSGETPIYPGQLRKVRISQSNEYDLLGEVIDDATAPEPMKERSVISFRPSDGRRALKVL